MRGLLKCGFRHLHVREDLKKKMQHLKTRVCNYPTSMQSRQRNALAKSPRLLCLGTLDPDNTADRGAAE